MKYIRKYLSAGILLTREYSSEIGTYRCMMLGDNLHTHKKTTAIKNKNNNKKQRKYTLLGRISLNDVVY